MWAFTGIFFLVKPGYGGAYEQLSVRTYPLQTTIQLEPQASWREFRVLKTILGEHLLVQTEAGTLHLDPISLNVRAKPEREDFKRLLNDALSVNEDRYGHIVAVHDLVSGSAQQAAATTNTGVELSLDWNTLSLSQRGEDTRLIGLLYKIHYLQWSNIKLFDTLLGVLGIALLLVLTIFGALMSFKSRQR